MDMKSALPPEGRGSVTANIEKVIRGQSDAIRKLLVALVSVGHVLLAGGQPGNGQDRARQGASSV